MRRCYHHWRDIKVATPHLHFASAVLYVDRGLYKHFKRSFVSSVGWISHAPSSMKAPRSLQILITSHCSSLFSHTFSFILTFSPYYRFYSSPLSRHCPSLRLRYISSRIFGENQRSGACWRDLRSSFIHHKCLQGVFPGQIGLFIICSSFCSAVLLLFAPLVPEESLF